MAKLFREVPSGPSARPPFRFYNRSSTGMWRGGCGVRARHPGLTAPPRRGSFLSSLVLAPFISEVAHQSLAVGFGGRVNGDHRGISKADLGAPRSR